MKLAKISGTLSRSSSSSSGSSGNNNQVAHTIADLPAQWMGATFGPGAPIQPLPSGDENQIPREIDYPISVNASLMPRTGYGLMPFDVLTQAYETVTEVRMPCSTIIRELCGFLPRLTDDDGNEVDDHPMKFLTVSPDRMTPFSVWLARFLQSKQVYDAGALFIMSDGHDLQGLRYIDGSTLFLIVDDHGEMPLPNQSDPGVRTSTQYVEKLRKWMEKHPDPYFDRHPSFEDGVSFHDTTLRKSRDGATILKTPAFAQVIHGVPFGWYSQDEIWYRPSMRRVNAPYGTSYIEMAWPWVVMIANIVAFELSHYRTGNMPEGWAAVPKDMFPTLEKIQVYELGFNQRMSSGPSERQRQRFVPEGTKWFPTKKADFPDQLYLQARDNISLLCGIPPSEYGKVPGQGLGGKGFADAMQSALFRMGLMPPKAYIDDAINENLKRFGVDDVFFELSIPTESTDPDKQKNTIKELFAAGLLTLNDALGQMNLNPVSGGDIHIIVSGGTVIVLEDYLKGKRDPPKGAPGIQSLPGATSGQPGVAGSSQSISEVASQATSESHGKGLMTKQDYKIVTKILETGKLPNTGVVYSIPLKTKMEKVDATHTDGTITFGEGETTLGKANLAHPKHLNGQFAPKAHQPVAHVDMQKIPSTKPDMHVIEDNEINKASRLDDHMDGQPIEELKRPAVDPALGLFVTPPEDPGNEKPRMVEGRPGVVAFDQLRDLDALQKHCGVCPEDDEYYQAPIARESTFDFPKDHHVNDVEIVAMMPEGLPAHAALWKPEGGEDETLAARIGGPQYLREEAAYLLDRSLKFFMVPVAYVASVDDEHGAALYYVMGNDPATDMDNYDPEWVERAAIEDYIMQNTDRHAGNYLTHPDDPRRPVLIDNGLSFPATDQYFRSPFVDAMQGEGFSEESLDAIEHCLRDAATWTDIRDLVGEEACELAQTRAEELLEEGGIPDEAPTTIAGTGTDSDGNITDEGRELTGDLDKAAPIHLPKGSPNGGQFAPAGTGKKAKRPKRAKKPRKPKQPRQKHVRAAGKGDIQPHAMITGFTEKK